MLRSAHIVMVVATALLFVPMLVTPDALARQTPFSSLALEQTWDSVGWKERGRDGPFDVRWYRSHVEETQRRSCFIGHDYPKYLYFRFYNGDAEESWSDTRKGSFTWRLIFHAPAYDDPTEGFRARDIKPIGEYRTAWKAFKWNCELPKVIEDLFNTHLPSS